MKAIQTVRGEGRSRQLLALLSVPLFALFILLVTVAPALALQFMQPAQSASVTEGLVLFSWSEPAVLFTLSGSAPVPINGTNTTRTLSAGAYVANITNSTNGSATVSFTVVAATTNSTNTTGTNSSNNTSNQTNGATQTITLTTDAPLYEVGTSARIRVIVATPEALALKVQRIGGTIDSFTVNVQQQTDFLYALSAPGSYTVSATGASATASTSFTAQNTSLGVAITGDVDGTAGRIASFGSTVTGGSTPFTYRWMFSDNTTSTGSTVDHVFDLPGNYTVTLIVTDASGKTASTSRTIEIIESVARATITVVGQLNRLLVGSTVVLGDTRASRSAITDQYGSVRFSNLPLGNYTINVSYNATELVPVQNFTNSTMLLLTRDRSITITLPVPDPRSLPPPTQTSPNASTNATNGTNASSSNSGNSANAGNAAGAGSQSATNTPSASAATQVSTPAQSTPSPSSVGTVAASSNSVPSTGASAGNSAESAAAIAAANAAIEQARANALTEITATQAGLLRSDTRAELVHILSLDERFTQLQNDVRAAKTVEAIGQVLSRMPKDVTIMARDVTTTQRTAAEASADVEAYIVAIHAEPALADSVRYTLQQQSPISVSTKRTVVRVTRSDGVAPETYTVFSRETDPVPDVAYIEIVPKTIAADASALHVQGNHEVLESDPVLKFSVPSYAYYVSGEVTGDPTIFALPTKLQTPTGILGFVSVRFNLQNFQRSGLYIGGIAILVLCVLASNLYLRRRDSDPTVAFEELAELTLGLVERGESTAGKYLPELERLQQSLSASQQAKTADTLGVLRNAIRLEDFRRAERSLRESFTLGDLVATSAAYERLLAAHAALPEPVRSSRQKALDAAHADLESHVLKQEQHSSLGAAVVKSDSSVQGTGSIPAATEGNTHAPQEGRV